MKHILLIISILSFSIILNGQEKWMKERVTTKPTVYKASGKVETARIPPPEAYLNRLKSGKEQTANIIVDYVDFPDSAKQAFEMAVGIWETLIESDAPIHMRAIFMELDIGVLGSCAPTSYAWNFDGAPYRDTYYPIAVVEKILGRESTFVNEPDMIARFSTRINWYFGTDQNTPNNKYDFVTVVLHEIAHGLGFTGFFDTEGTQGRYGENPWAFDRYVHDFDRKQLIDTELFANPSNDLYKALTSGYLRFISPMFKNTKLSKLPRLYAPKIWDDGSSVYHLNDDTYIATNENALMTHAGGLGESNYNPGPLAMDMLADMGWKHIYIDHDEIKDVEELNDPVFIEAKIKSDFLLDTLSVTLFYSSNQFQSSETLPIPYIEGEAIFKIQLPVTVQQGIVSYYISATDEKERVFTRPSGAPEYFYNLRIGPDTISPEILHQPIPEILASGNEVEISLIADDNLGMDTVIVEYFVNGQPAMSFGLKNDSSTNYSGRFIFEEGQLSDGDSIEYRIMARDASSNTNVAYLPEEGYFTVPVFAIFEPKTNYVNDFNNSSEDFISSDFSIKTESGFNSRALHSPHPYSSPELSTASFNYSAILKYPIIIASGGMMSFDEVVLVEPGATGKPYGHEDFFDYVIVEGSKDEGVSWQPIIDGYDSGSNQNWLNAYNNGISGNNSTTVGIKEMMVAKSFELTSSGNFIVGDTILIRFRLFSDPFANGWGWVIDNIRIQIPVANQLLPPVSPGNISVYPNPFKDDFNVTVQTEKPLNSINISIYNAYGQLIEFNKDYNIVNEFKQRYSMAKFPSGVYIVVVKADGVPILSKKVIKN